MSSNLGFALASFAVYLLLQSREKWAASTTLLQINPTLHLWGKKISLGCFLLHLPLVFLELVSFF